MTLNWCDSVASMKELLIAPITVICGVSIFVIGQLVMRLMIDPILEQREVIGKIEYNLIFYASVLNNPTSWPPEVNNKLGETFLDLSAQLRTKTSKIFKYALLTRRSIVVDAAKIQKVCENLISLSNAVGNQTAKHQSIFEETVKLPDMIRALLELPGSC